VTQHPRVRLSTSRYTPDSLPTYLACLYLFLIHVCLQIPPDILARCHKGGVATHSKKSTSSHRRIWRNGNLPGLLVPRFFLYTCEFTHKHRLYHNTAMNAYPVLTLPLGCGRGRWYWRKREEGPAGYDRAQKFFITMTLGGCGLLAVGSENTFSVGQPAAQSHATGPGSAPEHQRPTHPMAAKATRTPLPDGSVPKRK
jgi:hypothetical protein